MKKIYLALCILFSFISVIAISQPSIQKLKNKLTGANRLLINDFEVIISDKMKQNASLRLLGKSSLKMEETPKWLSSRLDLRPTEDELIWKDNKATLLGKNFSVRKMQQYYHGILVEHGIISVAAKAGNAQFMQIEFYPIDKINTIPDLSEDVALESIKKQLHAVKYDWDETNKPKGNLVIVEDLYGKPGKMCLAYKFTIAVAEPFGKYIMYAAASDGRIVFWDNIIKHANATGSAATRYSGTQTITTDDASGVAGKPYRLRQTRNSQNIITLDYARRVQSTTNDALATDFLDNDNNWTTAEHSLNYDDAAHDVHFAMQYISDYWKNIHGRNGWDDANGEMRSYVHIRASASAGYDNAFWGGAAMYYGDGSYYSTDGLGSVSNAGGFKPLTSLDVSAHELGHAICQSTANLVYLRESGGMNEGFSDIWAACVENFSGLGAPKDPWKIGDEIYPSGGELRSMSNPKLHSNPDTYGGTFWKTVTLAGCPVPSGNTNDACGVHTNSGVLNHWFYLLTVGGSGTNDIGNSYSVTGLGFAKSEQITYLTELSLTPNSDYAAARLAAINAATILYGACSNEVVQTTNAWFAAGVGLSSDCLPNVEFIAFAQSSPEGNGITDNCSSIKLIQVPVKLPAASAQATTINFTYTGTATLGTDYSAPASITYAAGETGIKNLTISILNDAMVESSETVIANFTVNNNGGTASAGVNNQTFTLTITDDDDVSLPLLANPISENVLVSENFDASVTGTTFPAGWTSNLAFSGSTSVNKWAIGSGGAGITGKAAYISNSTTGGTPTYAYGYTTTSGTDRLLRLPSFSTTGLKNIKISFKYKVDGEYYPIDPSDPSSSAFPSLWDYARILYDPNGTGTSFFALTDSKNDPYALYGNGTAVSTFSPTSFPAAMENKGTVYAGIRWTNDAADGSALPIMIDEVKITGTKAGSSVAAKLGQTNTARILSGNFSSYLASAADTQLIAKITNIDTDIPCLTSTITEAGNGTRFLITPRYAPPYLGTQKVIQLTPSVANSTATYTLSLYYTSTELAIFGANKTNLKLVKINEGVDLDADDLADDNSTIITPISATEDVTNGVIVYTANITNGFSQFVLAEPTISLPISLLSFSGNITQSTTHLNWQTSAEQNAKGFDIERSMDGIHFENIGFVTAKNLASGSKYQFEDATLASKGTYYYRLQKIDVNGSKSSSKIIALRMAGSQALFSSVSPNPATTVLQLQLNSSINKCEVDICNAIGQKIGKSFITNGLQTISIPMQQLSAGTYLILVHANGQTDRHLVVKQ